MLIVELALLPENLSEIWIRSWSLSFISNAFLDLVFFIKIYEGQLLIFKWNYILHYVTGIWTSVLPVPTGETWIRYVLFNYPGIIAFLIMDAAIFIAAATLLSVQATQVMVLLFYIFIIHF